MNKLLLFTLLLCCGCEAINKENERYAKEAAAQREKWDLEESRINQDRLTSHGKVIGVLPDGRTVTRYAIKDGSATHYIYVSGSSDITVNRSVRVGKHYHNEVEAFLGEEAK